MKRTITFHEPYEFDDAAVQAYEWVIEAGGTMLFLLPRDKKRCIPYIRDHANKEAMARPHDNFHVEVTHGNNFALYGPRIAAVSIDELGMSRIEERIETETFTGEIEELRSYARKPDKHPGWTTNSHVENID